MILLKLVFDQQTTYQQDDLIQQVRWMIGDKLQKRKNSNSFEGRPKGKDFKQNDEGFSSKLKSMNFEALKNFDIPELKHVIDRFNKQMVKPIEMHTSIFLSKNPQRCLQHNNVSTLYCLNDHKPLCVTCMYQNNSHKKHKVVPLNRAGKQLSEDIRKAQQRIQSGLVMTDKLMSKTHYNLAKADKQYPQILNGISQFYKELQELLTEKKNEHISHIEKVWQKVRYEYSSYFQEFSKIKVFVVEQLEDIRKRDSQQFVLFNRNVGINLALLPEFLDQNLCQYNPPTYNQDLRKFRGIFAKIGSDLILTSPLSQIVKRQKQIINSQRAASKMVLKNRDKKDEPVAFKKTVENEQIQEKTPQKKRTESNYESSKKIKKKYSLSPKPFRYQPAISAHRPPLQPTQIKNNV